MGQCEKETQEALEKKNHGVILLVIVVVEVL